MGASGEARVNINRHCYFCELAPSASSEPSKENLLWVSTFNTIEELRAALVEFARHYNENGLVARHGYRSPARVRADQCQLDQNAVANLN